MKQEVAIRVAELMSDIDFLNKEIREIEDIQSVAKIAETKEILAMIGRYEETKGYVGDFIRAAFADFLVKRTQDLEDEIRTYLKEIEEL